MGGHKAFADLDELDAADINGYLMSQAVMRFDDDDARAAALGIPLEGQCSYLAGSGHLDLYDGTAWRPIIRSGTAVLVAGTVTVAETATTADSRIVLTSQTDGGTPGWLRVSARTPATSFTITSSESADTSAVAWLLIEPMP